MKTIGYSYVPLIDPTVDHPLAVRQLVDVVFSGAPPLFTRFLR